MKPLFTIHAGELLVDHEIERKFRRVNVWIPTKDTGVDLLVSNNDNTTTVSLQVKFSRDYLVTSMKDSLFLTEYVLVVGGRRHDSRLKNLVRNIGCSSSLGLRTGAPIS